MNMTTMFVSGVCFVLGTLGVLKGAYMIHPGLMLIICGLLVLRIGKLIMD